MIKRLSIVLLVIAGIVFGCDESRGYWINQKTNKYLDDGYYVSTFLYYGDEIIWSHFTWQEWREEHGGRLYVPIDSIPIVKKRDYETAKKMMEKFKIAEYKP